MVGVRIRTRFRVRVGVRPEIEGVSDWIQHGALLVRQRTWPPRVVHFDITNSVRKHFIAVNVKVDDRYREHHRALGGKKREARSTGWLGSTREGREVRERAGTV